MATATPILPTKFVTSSCNPSGVIKTTNAANHTTISTRPILFLSAPTDIQTSKYTHSLGTAIRVAALAQEYMSEWLCINDTIWSLFLWSQDLSPAAAASSDPRRRAQLKGLGVI